VASKLLTNIRLEWKPNTLAYDAQKGFIIPGTELMFEGDVCERVCACVCEWRERERERESGLVYVCVCVCAGEYR
jgi:hypothetical protein